MSESSNSEFITQMRLRGAAPTTAEVLRLCNIAEQGQKFKDAVLDELVLCHILNENHETHPRTALQEAITWNCQVAIDPSVSSDARALIEKGYAQAQEQAGNVCYRIKGHELSKPADDRNPHYKEFLHGQMQGINNCITEIRAMKPEQ